MEIALIIFTGIIAGFLFFIAYRLGLKDGIKQGEEKQDVIKIDNNNQRAFKQVNDFANFNG